MTKQTKTNTLINNLVSLAIDDFQKNEKYPHADAFAQIAAHLAVWSIASDNEAYAPDAVALSEAIHTLSTVLNAVDYSCKLSDAGLYVSKSQSHYQTVLSDSSPHPVTTNSIEVGEANTPFTTMLNTQQLSSLVSHAAEACAAFNTQQALIKQTPPNTNSLLHYSHAYAVTRTAFVYATGVAARVPEPSKQKNAFEKALRARLQADLFGETISPSFFLQIVSSETFKLANIVLLTLGILALSLQIAAICSVSVGLFMANLGLDQGALLIGGISSCTTGAANLSMRFFTQKKWREDNQLSLAAMQICNNGTATPRAIP